MHTPIRLLHLNFRQTTFFSFQFNCALEITSTSLQRGNWKTHNAQQRSGISSKIQNQIPKHPLFLLTISTTPAQAEFYCALKNFNSWKVSKAINFKFLSFFIFVPNFWFFSVNEMKTRVCVECVISSLEASNGINIWVKAKKEKY